MARDELVSDQELLDYLELFNSTVESARYLGVSQSSCSRRYRMFSERFGLGFDRVNERYQATENFGVLASLRQASQKLRVRQKRIRFTLGWQLGTAVQALPAHLGTVLPIRPMSSWRLVSLLEQRLLDVAVMGLLEFRSLLPLPLNQLRSRRVPLSVSMLCVPIARLDFELLARRDHPLQTQQELSSDALGHYPSPGLPLGMAPILMSALQSHGLASHPCGLTTYDQDRWEGFAKDGLGLSYAPRHLLHHLLNRYGISRLPYNLGIQDCLGIVGHRDVLTDATFPDIFKQTLSSLRLGLNGQSQAIQWLS